MENGRKAIGKITNIMLNTRVIRPEKGRKGAAMAAADAADTDIRIFMNTGLIMMSADAVVTGIMVFMQRGGMQAAAAAVISTMKAWDSGGILYRGKK